jgi:transcriptional regulator with XRE-family HTH domain
MGELKDIREREYARLCGVKIKQLREKANYSQEKLAEILECSEVSLSRVERGLQTMKFWRLVRLCDLCHVSLDYLLRDQETESVSLVPSYVVKLFSDAGEGELEILSRHMRYAEDEIEIRKNENRKRDLEYEILKAKVEQYEKMDPLMPDPAYD